MQQAVQPVVPPIAQAQSIGSPGSEKWHNADPKLQAKAIRLCGFLFLLLGIGLTVEGWRQAKQDGHFLSLLAYGPPIIGFLGVDLLLFKTMPTELAAAPLRTKIFVGVGVVVGIVNYLLLLSGRL